MNNKTDATDFGTCSCEDINAISDESDRPCVDSSTWDEGDADTASVKKEAKSDACPKEPYILKK